MGKVSSFGFWGRLALSLIVFSLAAAVALLAGLSAFLAYKPISLTSPQAERLLRTALPNYRVSEGELGLSWSLSGRGAGIALRELKMTSERGDELRAKSMTLYPSWPSLFWGFLELSGVALEDGYLKLASPQMPGGGNLEFLLVKNLRVATAYAGAEQRITLTDLALKNLGANRSGRGEAELELGCGDGYRLAKIKLKAELEPRLTRLLLAPFTPKRFAPCLTDTGFMLGWELPLTVEIGGDLSTPTALNISGDGITALLPFLPRKLRLDAAALSMTFGGDHTLLKRLVASADGLKVTADGRIAADGEAAIATRIDNLQFSALPRLWPEGVSANARSWVLENIPLGIVNEVTADLKIENIYGGARVTAMSGELRFSGLEVSYLKPMPPLTEGVGTAVFTDKSFYVTVNGGEIDGVRLEGAEVLLFDLDRAQERVKIRATGGGELPNLLAALSSQPIAVDEYLAIAAGQTSGRVRGELRMAFPLLKLLKAEDVELHAVGDGERLRLEGYANGAPLLIKKAKLEVTMERLRISGDAELTDSEFTFGLDDDFSTRSFAVNGKFAAAQIAAFNFNFPKGLLKGGAAEIVAEWSQDELGLAAAEFAADLRDCELNIVHLGVGKAAGEDARLRGTLKRQGTDNSIVANFSFEQAEGSADGRVKFTEGTHELREISLTTASLAQNTFTFAAIERADVWRMDMKGESWNAAQLLARFLGEDSEETPEEMLGDFNFVMELARLKLFEEGDLGATSGEMARAGGLWQKVNISTKIEGDPVDFKIIPNEKEKRYILLMGNLGGVLRSQGLTDRISGGQLEFFAAAASAERPIDGTVSIRDFKMGDFPFFVRLLNLASFSGAGGILGRPIKFDNTSAILAIENGNIKIEDGVARSDELVITFDGNIDLSKNGMQIEGALVPSYVINSIFNEVPILGALLTGGQGGIIALNYEISGDPRDPEVSSNPLSAVSPGLLKLILSGF